MFREVRKLAKIAQLFRGEAQVSATSFPSFTRHKAYGRGLLLPLSLPERHASFPSISTTWKVPNTKWND